ncbi:MAG: hypothetical protein IT361_06320 [Gemmatimonadaceae bacterium]|nr:hypothetical protein [Gemmatimonadaceae bacterium]
MPSISCRHVRAVLLLLFATIVAACGGGGDKGGPTQPPGNTGTLTLSAGTPAVQLSTGGSATAAVSIVRGGGFSGTVTLALSGLPTGVTGAFNPPSLDASTSASTLTLTAAANAAPGLATITITASGTGVTSSTTTVQVVVTQPTIAISLTPATLSITAGQAGSTVVNIVRSAGFTGAVTLALINPPTGVTGAFAPSPTTAITSTLSLNVASSVAAGNQTLTIRASATGVQDVTATLTLTVVASGPVGFSVAIDPVEFELPAGRGWSANGIVSIQRANGFAGPVSVSIQGLSFPAVVAVTPAQIAANQVATNALALAVDQATPGLYTGTVRVSAPGFADQTAQVRFRVSLPSTGSITWTYCRADRVPKWFAVRDGNGAWKHIVPAGPAAATASDPTRFSFDISSSTASVALVRLGEKTSASPLIEGHHWEVYYLSRQEVIDAATAECVDNRDTSPRTITGTVTGYQSFDAIIASTSRRGNAFVGSTGPLSTTFTAQNQPAGPFDLLLTRSSAVGLLQDLAVRSLVLRRGLDPATGVPIAPIDFATQGVAPASATLTFANLNGENFTNAMTFRTVAGLNAWFVASGQFASATRTWYGVPAAQQIAGDLHQITATTASTTARRQIIHFSTGVANRTLTFGTPLAQPAVSPVFTTPGAINAAGILAPEYASRVAMYYREQAADPRTLIVVATRGFLGGSTQYDVSVPQLPGTTGFMNFWYPRRGNTVRWTVTGGEGSTGEALSDSFCVIQGYCPVKPVAGVTYLSAQATGTVGIPQ